MTKADTATGRIVSYRTRGSGFGPITRLMSPGDLGQLLKPFVFLDIFRMRDSRMIEGMGLHPHSGIATVTVFTEGDLRFDDGDGNTGTIGYGGVEWMRAGRGVWHGRELAPGASRGIGGFQLWIALAPEFELSSAQSQYVEAADMPAVGPARLIVGQYAGAASPVRAPDGINYLLVTLAAGERWSYQTPEGHSVGWLALARGTISVDTLISGGELVAFDRTDEAIELVAGDAGAVFVIGSALPHTYDLHLGTHSVHSSRATLADGEHHIAQLRLRLANATSRTISGKPVPILG